MKRASVLRAVVIAVSMSLAVPGPLAAQVTGAAEPAIPNAASAPPGTAAPAPPPPVARSLPSAPRLETPVPVLSTPAPLAAQPPAAAPQPAGTQREVPGTRLAQDPVLSLGTEAAESGTFEAAIRATVDNHPATAEANALEDEARYGVSGARQLLLPRIDTSLSSYRVIARDFSNDPFNVIERSRPRERTDGLVSVQQTLYDFGATSKQIRAASARLKAAKADAEASATQIAVGAIAAWYDVFGYRALTALATAFLSDQRQVRVGMQDRIRQGVSAEADLAGVDSAIARAQSRLAQYARGLANAEARFEELTGAPPPADLPRAPVLGRTPRDREDASALGKTTASVRSAEANATAIAQDAAAAKAQRRPLLTGAVDAGRYGVFENSSDYDVRASVTIRQRFLGGAVAQLRQSQARAVAAEARADRVREEGSRDAAIAFADVAALQTQLDALEMAYVAARRSRDATFERFKATRGTLYDVLSVQQGYFESATGYIQGLVDLDAARYVLLARTDRLLPALGIDVNRMQDSRFRGLAR